MFSVVSPFYNEEAILELSVKKMLQNLAIAGARLGQEWELVIVNDGSKDNSIEIAHQLASENPRLKVISYFPNQGRGYAIRKGVRAARGEYVVTTEIDSSWGDDIAFRLVDQFRVHPGVDMVIASPNLPGGGYRNVPLKRVFLSRFGNSIIRAGFTGKITMNTGMTRAYRREKFLALPLEENEKEIHLEIINKAMAFQYRIIEIPAFIEWQNEALSRPTKEPKKRKSSAQIRKLIRTHLSFSFEVAPFRYLYTIAGLCALVGTGFSVASVYRFLYRPPAIYSLLTGMLFYVLGLLLFGIGVLTKQNWVLLRNSWRTQSLLLSLAEEAKKPEISQKSGEDPNYPTFQGGSATQDFPPKPLF